MPANLPPEYYAAETRFKDASTAQEKIAALESLISTVPKHKGTDKLRADLRRRLSRLREESTRKKRGSKTDLYSVEKQGAAQIALVGFPNTGKSSLLAAVTNARPCVADYPMSTVLPLSAMMPFEDIQFQLVDLPPVGNETTDSWVSGILRSASMLLLVVDLSEEPDIQTDLLLGQIADWKIPVLQSNGGDGEEGGSSQKPLIISANKTDLPSTKQKLAALQERYDPPYPVIGFSAKEKSGTGALKKALFQHSRIIRVYAKQPGKKPDLETPFILPLGSHVLLLAEIIHKDFVTNFKYACIWGSAKYDGQRVQKDYILHDRDIVEYHSR